MPLWDLSVGDASRLGAGASIFGGIAVASVLSACASVRLRSSVSVSARWVGGAISAVEGPETGQSEIAFDFAIGVVPELWGALDAIAGLSSTSGFERGS